MVKINTELKQYIENNILTLYDNNIGGHGIEHIKSVIDRSFELVNEFKLDVNLEMVYVIAAFHDIGYKINPDEHEEVSSKIFKENQDIKKFFNEEQINIISEAIIDHRASLEYEARSIYGKIVSSADREISVENMLERSIKFQSDKHKDENPSIMQVIDYSYKKLLSKYGKGGYAKMYFQDKKYLDYLNKMQKILEDKEKFIVMELKIIRSMNKIKILKATKKHREFIIYANNVINNVNETKQTNGLEQNIDKDYFCEEPKFHCLIAEIYNKPVGMILYSYFYWANDGQVLWISQMFVEEKYRKQGVFFELIRKLREENQDIKLVSCATSDENKRMQKILNYYNAHEIKLKFYYKKI